MEFTRPMNEIRKIEFSKTLQRADWPETRARLPPRRSTATPTPATDGPTSWCVAAAAAYVFGERIGGIKARARH
jgi:hypothetical protein